MQNPLLNIPYASDSRIIRRNLDTKESSILVVERKNPDHILVIEAYVSKENVPTNSLNQNLVVCTTFGNELERYEFDINDIMIYRSL